jgi:carbon-monoxide dehydrogenase large subunit
MNAVVDALAEYGIRHIDMPATPFRVWQAIQAAGAAAQAPREASKEAGANVKQ